MWAGVELSCYCCGSIFRSTRATLDEIRQRDEKSGNVGAHLTSIFVEALEYQVEESPSLRGVLKVPNGRE